VFVKLIAYLNALQIKPVFCGMNKPVAAAFRVAGVFAEGDSLVLANLDLALKSIEDKLLAARLSFMNERTQADL
jgi:hypothetical protein